MTPNALFDIAQTHPHARTHTHSHAKAHPYTHTRTLFLSLSLSLSLLCYQVNLLTFVVGANGGDQWSLFVAVVAAAVVAVAVAVGVAVVAAFDSENVSHLKPLFKCFNDFFSNWTLSHLLQFPPSLPSSH